METTNNKNIPPLRFPEFQGVAKTYTKYRQQP